MIYKNEKYKRRRRRTKTTLSRRKLYDKTFPLCFGKLEVFIG